MAKKRIITETPLTDASSDKIDDISKSSYGGDNIEIELPRGSETTHNWNGDEIATSKMEGKQSLFNNYYIFRNPSNVYTDVDFAERNRKIINPSAMDLINNRGGANRFDLNDFLYLKKYNQLPINRLVSLRRFAYPVGDSIVSDNQIEPDICRLLTYSDQENNTLTSLMSMTFGVKWKELTSANEEISMSGDPSGASGFQKSILNVVDPSFGNQSLTGANKLNVSPTHDSNKVHGPVDTIASTHIRDIGINFEQPIELTFEWDLKSIDGLNAKAAFLDLLGNILAMTTNDAKFWGGSRHYTGSPRPSRQAKDLRKLSNEQYMKYTNKGSQSLKSYVSGMASNLFSLENIQQVAENLGKLAMGGLMNKVGRKSIPVMNSLLTGAPVGEYHVTIGNPLDPIMTIGNLILESSTLAVPSGALGNDNFPTALVLTCTLKHAMPRGRAEIEAMFAGGESPRMYWKPTEDERKELHGGSKTPKSLEGDIKKGIDDVIKNLYPFSQDKSVVAQLKKFNSKK
jgi:hypothetical protein